MLSSCVGNVLIAVPIKALEQAVGREGAHLRAMDRVREVRYSSRSSFRTNTYVGYLAVGIGRPPGKMCRLLRAHRSSFVKLSRAD